MQLFVLNEEYLVSMCHQHMLTSSLPFVHTARRFYRLQHPVRSLEDAIRKTVLPKLLKSYVVEEEEVVTRYGR